MIKYYDTIDDFYELTEKMSNSAKMTLEIIKANKKEEEFMEFLESICNDSDMTLLEIDDFIDFDGDYILKEVLNINNY